MQTDKLLLNHHLMVTFENPEMIDDKQRKEIKALGFFLSVAKMPVCPCFLEKD